MPSPRSTVQKGAFCWLSGNTISGGLFVQPPTSFNEVVDVRFSNRPFRVKRFQTIHDYSVDVAHGLVLLFGIGTKALSSWGSRRGGTIFGSALPLDER